ncbi:MAG: hopanoid biosynthesis-associated protein HpnK [Snowella sp.]
MTSKYLIINGDDFGFSSSVNHAIIESHEQGILTSTSLMVSGQACTEAVNLAKNHPDLGVGLHLVLVCGQSVLPYEKIPHLVDRDGNFLDDPVKAGLIYQFNREARKELALEIRAQLEKFQETGLPMSHLDGHLHLHVHPVVLGIIKDLAAEFALKVLRLPFEELNFTLAIDRSHFWTKFVWFQVFGQLRRHGEGLFKNTEVIIPAKVYGLLATGRISEDYLLQLIPKIQTEIAEIYAHPDCSSLSNPSGPMELQTLLSHQVRDRIQACGFELINFHTLKKLTVND